MNNTQSIISLEYIIRMYGIDALEPVYIPSREGDGEDIIIPKMRDKMLIEEWFLLPQELRLFICEAFIKKFQ